MDRENEDYTKAYQSLDQSSYTVCGANSQNLHTSMLSADLLVPSLLHVDESDRLATAVVIPFGLPGCSLIRALTQFIRGVS